MKAANALLRRVESLGVILWVEGDQLRYKARQPVSDGLKNRIRQHKPEIINLLRFAKVQETIRPKVPEWCDPGCTCFCRLEFPDLPMVMGCYQENDSSHWRWSRLDKMTYCPNKEHWR